MSINIRELEYLRALHTHKTFKHAAAAIPISQPTLSIQISKLENYLGVQLLERGKKNVTLTDVGLEILQRAETILDTVDEIRELAETAKDPEVGSLKLGIFPTLAPYLLPFLIKPLSSRFSRLSLTFHEQKSEELLKMLEAKKLDVAILSENQKLNQFNSTLLFKEELLVAASDKNPLTKKEQLTTKDLTEDKILLLEDGHCLRDQVINLCELAKVKTELNFTTTSLETIRQLVAADTGISIIPKLAACKTKGVTYLPFKAPAPTRDIYACFRKDTSKSKIIETLVELVRTL